MGSISAPMTGRSDVIVLTSAGGGGTPAPAFERFAAGLADLGMGDPHDGVAAHYSEMAFQGDIFSTRQIDTFERIVNGIAPLIREQKNVRQFFSCFVYPEGKFILVRLG